MLANYFLMVGTDLLHKRLFCVVMLIWVFWSIDDIFVDVWHLINNFHFASLPLYRVIMQPYPHEAKFNVVRKALIDAVGKAKSDEFIGKVVKSILSYLKSFI